MVVKHKFDCLLALRKFKAERKIDVNIGCSDTIFNCYGKEIIVNVTVSLLKRR